MSILVIAEHDNNNLKGSTLNTITAASKLSDDISLLIAGSNINSVVEESQTIDGVNKIQLLKIYQH
jgi:electron transfer flavoprotein alpha subunit